MDWLEGRRPEAVAPRSAATVMILRDRRVADGDGAVDPSSVDASSVDASAVDASAVDASAVDASAVDASAVDASAVDASAVEVFMQRRASTMAFAPRMMVFPGGGVDPRDADPSLPWAGPSPAEWGRVLVADETTARELVAAAVREVFEECGVLLAGPSADSVVGDVSGPQWQAERRALLSREVSLAQMLIRRGLVLRSDLLRARAHWITPEFEPKRYDTRIFVAVLPDGQIADDQTTEADHAGWVDPARLLQDHAAGLSLMLPPTVVCVEQVAAASSAAGCMAAEVRVAPITPVLTRTDDAVVIRCVLPT